MQRIDLDIPPGVRWVPDAPSGLGVLALAGSSGRIDDARARLFASHGAFAESIRWFGGPGQHPGPWEIPLETFAERAEALASDCDRVALVGTSFGAEAALATAAVTPGVDAVAAFAPSDVVWAGITPDGRQTSHWTLDGTPLPYVALDDTWEPDDEPPSYHDLYLRSRAVAAEGVEAATIASESVPTVVLVAGGDDLVWPALLHAESIVRRRASFGLETTLVTDEHAGHRTILPGEPVVRGGSRMRRGGTTEADRRLGDAAWAAITRQILAVGPGA